MRDLYWSGGYNVRDLGGLPTTDGADTARRAVVRSAHPDRMTAHGWRALTAYGVRTVIDLRNGDEVEPSASAPREAVARVRVPVDEIAGRDWYVTVRHLDGTPRIFTRYLADHPEAVAAVVKAVAAAAPGGVLVHCGGGRDRAGLAALVLLAPAGVEPEAIAADYVLSYERQRAACAALGNSAFLDNLDLIDRRLAEDGTTAHDAVLAVLDGLDLDTLLLRAGATAAEIAAARARLRPAA